MIQVGKIWPFCVNFAQFQEAAPYINNINYDERGTFKIDRIFVFGSNSFSMRVHRALLH